MNHDVHISERAAGLTAYYFAGKLAEIRRRMAEGQDIINLGVGSPDLTPADGVIDGKVDASINVHKTLMGDRTM